MATRGADRPAEPLTPDSGSLDSGKVGTRDKGWASVPVISVAVVRGPGTG